MVIFLVFLLIITYSVIIFKYRNPWIALRLLAELGVFFAAIHFFNVVYPELLLMFSIGVFAVLFTHWMGFIISIINKYRDLITYYIYILLDILFILGDCFYDLLDSLLSALDSCLCDLWRCVQYFPFFVLNIFLVIYRRLRKK